MQPEGGCRPNKGYTLLDINVELHSEGRWCGWTGTSQLHNAVGSSSLFCRVRPCAVQTVIFVALAKQYALLSGCGL